MEKNQLAILLTVFIAVLIGVILMTSISDQVNVATGQPNNTIYNESLSGAAETTFFVSRYTRVTEFYDVRQMNGTVLADGVGVVTNVSKGSVLITVEGNNSDATTGYYVDYVSYSDGYIREGTSRTLLNLIPLFFALGLLGIAAVVFLKSDIFDKI